LLATCQVTIRRHEDGPESETCTDENAPRDVIQPKWLSCLSALGERRAETAVFNSLVLPALCAARPRDV